MLEHHVCLSSRSSSGADNCEGEESAAQGRPLERSCMDGVNPRTRRWAALETCTNAAGDDTTHLPPGEIHRGSMVVPIINRLFIMGIYLYRCTLRHYFVFRGTRCLHHPSCSEYGRLALVKYPLRTALAMTWRRYTGCNPLSGRPYIDFP